MILKSKSSINYASISEWSYYSRYCCVMKYDTEVRDLLSHLFLRVLTQVLPPECLVLSLLQNNATDYML